MKVCKDCKIEKPLSEFYKSVRDGPWTKSYCKSCDKIRAVAYRKANREKINARANELAPKYKYGISLEQYQVLLDQGCEICGSKHRLQIDHDHSCCPGQKTCGKCVRGILCAKHNRMLGFVNDSVEELQKLIGYLTSSKVLRG